VIGPDAIAAFRYGVFNAHAGDLPRYRGNACPNWAILNGEERRGVCVHRMTPGVLDSGPILGRRFLPLTEDAYIGDVYDWLETAIPELFVEVVRGLEAGTAVEQHPSPNPADGLRCYPRRPEDSEIDWERSATDVLRLIRASSHPFAGAYSCLEGRDKLTVWRAVRYEHAGPYLAVPGQILLRAGQTEGDPVVSCGQGAIRLVDLSMENVHGAEAAALVTKSLRNRLGFFRERR
jgi:methionyl-tRNA formyltransferase